MTNRIVISERRKTNKQSLVIALSVWRHLMDPRVRKGQPSKSRLSCCTDETDEMSVGLSQLKFGGRGIGNRKQRKNSASI